MSSGDAAAELIELSSDEEEEPAPSTTALALALACRDPPSSPPDIKPHALALALDAADVKPLLLPLEPPGYGALVPVPVKAEEPAPVPIATASPPPRALPPPRLCRQFWKSGDYVVAQRNPDADAPGGGPIAELLDNAIDEVNNGATSVRVNKFTNPRDGSPSLLVQDDGGGMDPEALRRCMSFGFSDKQSDAFIGQYGNGFKTSTMRLGADVIVFTQNQTNWVPTRSIGLLSYTFLMETGCDDVLVPTVDYQYDLGTASFTQMLRHDQKLFSSNLSILLKWSPFASESELLKQFDDIGEHGTKIIVYNLWFNDDGDMELDFNSDKKARCCLSLSSSDNYLLLFRGLLGTISKDILITGAHKKVKTNNLEKIATQNYVSNRLRYSLRPHNIVNDLMYRECVLYKPQIAGITESSVITTLGFVKGAPDIDVQGFNVYHKNRLISPFWKVANNSYGKGRGVVGILEANFIKPTHDKQDFEKSVLYQRLEIRLKDMTYEYWDLHCHRVGYDNKKLPKATRALNRASHMNGGSTPASAPPRLLAADIPTSNCGIPRLSAFAAREKINLESLSKSKMGLKRKFDTLGAITDCGDWDGPNHMDGHDGVSQRRRFNEHKTLTLENEKLRNECLQYEESEKQLVLKEQKLRFQIAEARKQYQELLEEHRSLDVKKE
ncbi:hypothetical protein ACP4OV_011600 [Aristida adscensionis]